jgi:soluble lytic murein transglycosylase
MDLKDFGYGLKAPSMPESPLKYIPNAAAYLEIHMNQYNADWKLLYPFAYREQVESLSASADVDPFLILSLMRAESVYDPKARSGVGARGLMQIMPFTAVRIARMMQDTEFQLIELHQPEVNIGYAAFYIKKLSDYYKGNTMMAVAAYNGGPGPVDKWINQFGDLELDEFIETIPFRETRRYVKSVFRNYNNYKHIWQQSKALAALPKVPDGTTGGEIF